MRIAPLADVKARLSAYVEQAEAEGPVIITRNGKPVAVLIAPEDDDDLERLVLSRSPQFQAIIDRSVRSIREGRGMSHAEFWRAARERSAKRSRNKAAL